jgi:SAM-dependent methyltransferase
VEWHNRQIKSALAGVVRAYGSQYLRGRLIDIGCGTKPYEADLRPYIREHVGVDHQEASYGLARVDIVASAYDIPVADESFDSALATEVLEHLEEPLRALKEWHRILRPDATLLVTTPFMWHLHDEPRDFYRYSPHGLRYLIEQAGFEVVEIRKLGGFWSTFGQLLSYVFLTYDKPGNRGRPFLSVLGATSQRIGVLMERHSRKPDWPSHVVAVARRPR